MINIRPKNSNVLPKYIALTLIATLLLIPVNISDLNNKQTTATPPILKEEFSAHVLESYTEDFDRQITLPSGFTYSLPPYVVDFNDDGKLETIIVSDRENQTSGSIIVEYKNQKIAEGWPIQVGWEIKGILGSFYDPNQEKEAIMFYTTEWNGTHTSTILFAVAEDGTILHTYNSYITDFEASGELFADINNDDIPEIVFVNTNGSVLFLNIEGINKNGWPKDVNDTVFSKPVAEDLNEDGLKDIIVCTDSGQIYAWNQNGTLINGYPLQLNRKYPSVNEGFREMPVVADFNNDSYLDLFIGSTVGVMYGITLDPTINKTWTYELESSIYGTNQVINYDLDRDQIPEIIQPLYNGIVSIKIVNDTLTELFNYQKLSRMIGPLAISDITRDNVPEILLNDLSSIIVLSNNGTIITSLNKISSSSEYQAPLVYDLENDKEIEIVYLNKFGVLHIFETNDFGFMRWTNPLMSPFHTLNIDQDGDGLWDFEENILGTNNNTPDTDSDGIDDGLEINQYVLNPLLSDRDNDTDNDQLTNVDEVNLYNTHPLNPDSDFDLVLDGEEVLVYHTNPLSQDTDGDGMTDTFETEYYPTLNPNNPNDADEDPDNDGLLNINEQAWGTDPTDPDTDEDGLIDGDEVYKYITNPLEADADKDYDGDGLSNVDEVDKYHTDPTNPDTDRDGYSDYEEIKAGSDPLDANSIPKKKTNYWLFSFLSVPALLTIITVFMKKTKR